LQKSAYFIFECILDPHGCVSLSTNKIRYHINVAISAVLHKTEQDDSRSVIWVFPYSTLSSQPGYDYSLLPSF